MKNLSKLLPAQTLFITKGEHAQLKELLKLTFMDLLLKKVLKVTDLTRQANAKDKPITNTYVEIGANYDTYLPLPFEEGLLSTFAKDKDQTILLRHFIKISYLNAKSTANFQKQIYNTSELDGIFKRSWFQTIFGRFSYTDWGSEF